MALTRSTRSSLQIALGYAVVCLAYIVLSGNLAARLAVDVDQLQTIERLKGGLFVTGSALGLFFACKAVFGRLERSALEVLRHERTLVANERRIFAGLLASSVAHDANNVLMGVTSDLAELTEDPASAQETLTRLHKAVERLINLNRRLVQATRLNVSAQHQTLELSASVKEALDLSRAHPSLRQARLTFTGTPITITTQPLLIAQIVNNLVINAGEATGGRGAIDVEVRSADGEATIEVSDDGPGVPALARPTLFEALATTKPDGGGLGLFSVRACAHSLGGRVEVTEGKRGGASFLVHLPLVRITSS